MPLVLRYNSDKVWLSMSNISTMHPSRKLDWKRLGPYKILRKIGIHAYELELPDTIKIHPVFDVSLLEAAANDPLPEQMVAVLPLIEVNREQEWLMEDVLDSEIFGRWNKLHYQIKWRGYADQSWEPAEGINGLPVIDKFHS
jgi:hypothetical protein